MEDHEDAVQSGGLFLGHYQQSSPSRVRLQVHGTPVIDRRGVVPEVSQVDEEESSEEDEEELVTESTTEAAIAAKQSIERFYKNLFHSLKDRENR